MLLMEQLLAPSFLLTLANHQVDAQAPEAALQPQQEKSPLQNLPIRTCISTRPPGDFLYILSFGHYTSIAEC